MTQSIWKHHAGDSLGGLTVGHLAKMNSSADKAYIVGLRKDGERTTVHLRFLKPQLCGNDNGVTSLNVERDSRSLSATWRSAATVRPHLINALPDLHEFGTAPQVVPTGYRKAREICGTEAKVQALYKGQHVVLVKSAELIDQPGEFLIGVFEWTPIYAPWRKGGCVTTRDNFDSATRPI